MAVIQGQLRFDYPNEEWARTISEALAVDDCQYIATSCQGTTVVCHLESATLMSLLHTLNDFLPCVKLAEQLMDKELQSGTGNREPGTDEPPPPF